MTIKTKSIFRPAEEEDGLRILITRFYPRGVKKEHFDLWIRELSPSVSLLSSYKKGECNWQEFKINFLSELRDNIDSLEAVHALNDYSSSQDITLLCYEKQNQPCHRHLVRDILQWPELLRASFEPQDTDDHKRCSVLELIPHKKSTDIPFIFAKP